MAGLLRIVLIHTHLEGVVELDLQGHANICGTNASGKTTLQRLIPVFYGELPNKVVPKTRKKFDDFYLPHTNSYLVYEYQREQGDLCQVVLTRRAEGGVDYRFVPGAYEPSLYLLQQDQGLVARQYSDWASHLRQQQRRASAKISATSEYRSVLQNDFSFLRAQPRSAQSQLRRLAQDFSLVSGAQRLRHMEKLVSAVHAKEGKMDTLRTMLAAIFEEEGVELPSTQLRASRVREWIQAMRQSRSLSGLQAQLQQLEQGAQELARLEAELQALGPLVESQLSDAQQTQASAQEEISALEAHMQQAQQHYQIQKTQYQDQLSQLKSDLKQISLRLDDVHQRYAAYQDAGMTSLAADVEQLEVWQQQVEQDQQHLALLERQAEDVSRFFEQQRLQQAEAQLAFQQQHQQQRDALRAQEQQQQLHQQEQHQALQEQALQRLQDVSATYQQQQHQLEKQLASLQARLDYPSSDPAQRQALQAAQQRVEQARQQREQHQQQVQQQASLLRRQQQRREQAAEQQLVCRRALNESEDQLADLERQRHPSAGSLRAFLREQHPGWEQHLGKVLRDELLERRDLAPQLAESAAAQCYGLELDLSNLPCAPGAQEELMLAQSIAAAQAQRQARQAELEQAEVHLRQAEQEVKTAQEALDQAQLVEQQAQQQLIYAQEAWQRLVDEQAEQERALEAELREQHQACWAQIQALEAEAQQAFQALDQQREAQRLELEADAQQQRAEFQQRWQQLEQALADFQQAQREQEQELQAACDAQLQQRELDPDTLRQVRQRIQQRQQRIQKTRARKAELLDYQQFIRVDWQQLKPEWLEQEEELKSQLWQVEETLRSVQQQQQQQEQQCHKQLHQAQKQAQQQRILIDQLIQLRDQWRALELTGLQVAEIDPPRSSAELLDRTRQALKDQQKRAQEQRQALSAFEGQLLKEASADFSAALLKEKEQLEAAGPVTAQMWLALLADCVQVLASQQASLLLTGRNYGEDLSQFFTVFRDLNRRIGEQSRRLSAEVADDLLLEGIQKAEVKIESTIDELGFWKPLQHFSQLYQEWRAAGHPLPEEAYLDALSEVAELLRSDQELSFASLLRLELHLNEGGSDLIIRNDRQLLESSSHGMAYLILCKFLLAFTRLLRGSAQVVIHWPIDEIGTLAYHNVEKLFQACDQHQISIVGAFPNPESEVLMLFQQRYLIDRDQQRPHLRQLKRIQPQLSRLAAKLQARQLAEEKL
ncbi:ATP-binding protein [Marinospirillum sp. MEB164]|uniref:ATP-binding protein n=1 Tax=Marinospirillum alkalitolerans TaxID=3123374 RepID=A0ABW8Q0D6_9GAMM